MEAVKNEIIKTITLNKILDAAYAKNLKDILQADAKNAQTLYLDFSQVEFLDSSGLGVLSSFQQYCNKQQKYLLLENVSETVMLVFQLTGSESIFNFIRTQKA